MIKGLLLTTVIFATLKIADVIAWSWVAVTTPLWLPLIVLIIVLAIAFAIEELSQ